MVESNDPAQQSGDASGPAAKFIASMTITYEMWHDGNGYDLDALRAIPPSELAPIEAILINHSPRDWRDIEALGHIDSEAARRAVDAALNSSDPAVRREALNYSRQPPSPVDRERLLLRNLAAMDLDGGLGAAIDEAAEFHPPAVVDALFRGVVNRAGEIATLFAGLLFFIHGKSAAPFDWDHRPFFLRFNTASRHERRQAFIELCQTVGADPDKYLPPTDPKPGRQPSSTEPQSPADALRQKAMNYYRQASTPANRERLLLQYLAQDMMLSGPGGALDEATWFHPPAVVKALFFGALGREGPAAVQFAEALALIHGKSEPPIDEKRRSLLQRFNTADRNERKQAFIELCQAIGADPYNYLG